MSAQMATHTSPAYRSPSRRSGAVTWAYSDASAECCGLRGRLAVEGEVAAAAQQPGGSVDHRGVRGDRRVEGADEVRVEQLGRPLDAERPRGPVQALDVARVRQRQGAQQPDPRVDHQVGGGEAGEQRELGVPPLHRQLLAELQVPSVALDVDVLLGQRQRHPAADGLAGDPELADLAQQRQRLVGGAVVDRALHVLVGRAARWSAPAPAPRVRRCARRRSRA